MCINGQHRCTAARPCKEIRCPESWMTLFVCQFMGRFVDNFLNGTWQKEIFYSKGLKNGNLLYNLAVIPDIVHYNHLHNSSASFTVHVRMMTLQNLISDQINAPHVLQSCHFSDPSPHCHLMKYTESCLTRTLSNANNYSENLSWGGSVKIPISYFKLQGEQFPRDTNGETPNSKAEENTLFK